MRMVPPMRWEDLATKQDLEALRSWAAERFDAVDRRLDDHDRRFDAVLGRLDDHDRRFAVVMQRFETTDERTERAKNEILAAFRGELLSAVTGQTRQLTLTMAATVATLGGIALALARFG